MITNKDFDSIKNLQKVMAEYKKITEGPFKMLQGFNANIAGSMKSIKDNLTQWGINHSGVLKEYRRISEEAGKSFKFFSTNIMAIQKQADWIAKIDSLPIKGMLKELKQFQDNIKNMPYAYDKNITINPTLLIPHINKDEELKRLVKTAIKELEEERYQQERQEREESSKKRGVKGFGHK
jgi:hypothetical protein